MAIDHVSITEENLYLHYDPAYFVAQENFQSRVRDIFDEVSQNYNLALEPIIKDVLRDIRADIDFDCDDGPRLVLKNPVIEWFGEFDLKAFFKEQHEKDPEFFTNLRGLLRSIDEERLGPP